MSKQILPHEMAEIVAGLLTNPEKMGYFDEASQFEAFFAEIGQVVVDHCGGVFNGVNGADYWDESHPYGSSPETSPMASVSYCPDSIGNPDNCIWSPYDQQGWEDDVDAGDVELEMSHKKRRSDALSQLISRSVSDGIEIVTSYEMADWNEEERGVNERHNFSITLGNQVYGTISKGDEVETEVILEVNKGRPCVHIQSVNEDSDPTIHVFDTDEGLIITPDDTRQRLEGFDSESNEYAYHAGNSVILRK